MNQKKFDAATIKNKMHNSKEIWGLRRFLEHYECSEAEFVRRLEKLYEYKPYLRKEIIAELKAVDEDCDRNLKSRSKKKKESSKKHDEIKASVKNLIKISEEKTVDILNETPKVSEDILKTDSISECINKIESLKNQIDCLNKEKSEFDSANVLVMASLIKVKKELKEIEERFVKKAAEANELLEEYHLNEDEIQSINDKIISSEVELEDEQLRLKKMQTKKIFFGNLVQSAGNEEDYDYIISSGKISEKYIMYKLLNSTDTIKPYEKSYSFFEIKEVVEYVLMYEKIRCEVEDGYQIEIKFENEIYHELFEVLC